METELQKATICIRNASWPTKDLFKYTRNAHIFFPEKPNKAGYQEDLIVDNHAEIELWEKKKQCESGTGLH
jgi:hypothetical protein